MFRSHTLHKLNLFISLTKVYTVSLDNILRQYYADRKPTMVVHRLSRHLQLEGLAPVYAAHTLLFRSLYGLRLGTSGLLYCVPSIQTLGMRGGR